MDNIDVIYMDDDFKFEDQNDIIDINEQHDDLFDELLINKTPSTSSQHIETNKKIDIIDIEEQPISNDDFLSETYNVIDKYTNLNNKLKICNNELKLLKIKYETLENEYNALEKKYNKEVIINENNNNEIKSIRRELINSNKSKLMLKTLLELIINKYGIDSVSQVTKLNEEQIRRYLK